MRLSAMVCDASRGSELKENYSFPSQRVAGPLDSIREVIHHR